MKSDIEKYKGIPPGKVIEREIIRRNTSQRELAAHIGKHFQTLNAVINGRRKLTMELADKLDHAFHFEPGFFYILQSYHEIALYQKEKAQNTITGIPNIRRILFWDTDFDKIDWAGSKAYVIE